MIRNLPNTAFFGKLNWCILLLLLAGPVKAQFHYNHIIPLNDIHNTPQSSPVTWSIANNDFYPMPIDTVLTISGGNNGTAILNQAYPNSFTYTPNNNFNGLDSFTYLVTAANASTAIPNKVYIVVGTNNIIKCNYDFAVANTNNTVSIPIKDNDYSKLPTAITVLTPPVHGTYQVLANGNIQYTPTIGYTGRDSFLYQLTQTISPFNSDQAWAYLSVCTPYTPNVSNVTSITGGLNFNVSIPATAIPPFYYGIINDTALHSAGYNTYINSANYTQNINWNIPQITGSHVCCVYIADNNYCRSQICFNTSVNNNCTAPPSPAFTYSYLNNQLVVVPSTVGSNYTHDWKISYNNPYVINPLYQSHSAVDTFKEFYASGSYTIFHKILDTSTLCFDTLSQSLYIFFSNADTFSGYVFYDNNLNGVFEPGYELPVANCNAIHIYDHDSSIICSLITDYSGYYSIPLRPDSIYITGNSCPAGILQTFPIQPLNYTLPAFGHHYAIKGLNFAFNGSAYHVQGHIFYDLNANNFIDIGEPNVTTIPVSIGNDCAYSDTTGYYSFFEQNAGTYPVSTLVKPGFQSTNFNLNILPGYINYPIDLSYLPLVNAAPDLAVQLFAGNNASVSDSAIYILQVKNTGNKTVSGTVKFNFNSGFSVHSTFPSGTVQGNTSISWHLPAFMAIGDVAYYKICLSPNAGLQVGSITRVSAMVIGDSTFVDNALLNNVDTLEQKLFATDASNNKTASPVGAGTSNKIAPSTNLVYTIHFRNDSGNPAANVIIIDTLDVDLDISSLELCGSSYSPSVVERKGRVIKWVFNNILLANYADDPSHSEGYVSFKISLLNGLPIHKKITNTAHIYMGGNGDKKTNTTQQLVEYFLGIDENDQQIVVEVYPNPMDDQTVVELPNNSDNYQLDLSTIDGKIVTTLQSNSGRFIVSRNNLPAGLYFIAIRKQQQVIATKKLVLR